MGLAVPVLQQHQPVGRLHGSKELILEAARLSADLFQKLVLLKGGQEGLLGAGAEGVGDIEHDVHEKRLLSKT